MKCMNKLNSIAVILLVFTVILEVVNIFLSNGVTTESIMATRMRDDLSALQEQNQNLRSEILQFTSFDTIASRAAQLGFVEGTQSISLNSPFEVASTQ